MEFHKNKLRDHQFLEVDEDLRRIAEREATKPLCPFGRNCYRKNPNHLQEYRHQSEYGSANKANTNINGKNAVKRGKITDFFVQKPTNVKKLTIESIKDDNKRKDYEIEEEEEVTNEEVTKEKPNSSHSREPTPKRKKVSPIKTENNIKIENKSRSKNSNNGSDFDNGFKSMISDGKCLSVIKSKTKRINTKTKRNTCSPNVRKLRITEDMTSDRNEITIKSNQSSEKTKIEQKLNPIQFDDSKEQKTSISADIKPKMTSNQWNQLIKEIFLFEMPKDFFQFWEFCKTIRREKPEDALIETLGLRLVGPYDVLTRKVDKNNIKDREQILCHYRFFYDLPEFQTIIASNKSGYHLGYFRDTPEEDNPVVVSNNSEKSCVIEGVADNICAAVYSEIQKQKSRQTSSLGLKQIESKLKGFCDLNKIDLKTTSKLKLRKTKINAKTFNNFGFVVPYDKKTEVGYRPLPLTDSELKKLLNTILKVDAESRNDCKSLIGLQDIIQLISYANDECDFGMGLELGIDLFCSGDPFYHKSALHLLSMAYDLLKRDAFSRIIRAHLQNRRKGYHLDSI